MKSAVCAECASRLMRVPGPVVVAEYAEHAAVDHGVDRQAEAAEAAEVKLPPH